MKDRERVQIHFILDNKLYYKKITTHIPATGDELRLGGEGSEKFFKVEHRVWVYDEPYYPFGRINIGISESDQ